MGGAVSRCLRACAREIEIFCLEVELWCTVCGWELSPWAFLSCPWSCWTIGRLRLGCRAAKIMLSEGA